MSDHEFMYRYAPPDSRGAYCLYRLREPAPR